MKVKLVIQRMQTPVSAATPKLTSCNTDIRMETRLAALGLIVAHQPDKNERPLTEYLTTITESQLPSQNRKEADMRKPLIYLKNRNKSVNAQPEPWNKHKLVGQKKPLNLKQVWEIRIRLQMSERHRDLALFNLAIDSKLRSCDLIKLRVADVMHGGRVASRAKVMQQKTRKPVQFEIALDSQSSIAAWIKEGKVKPSGYLFPSRIKICDHLSTRQYARILDGWINEIGLDTRVYGTHSMRRTKATLIYRRTKNIRAVQLLLGHTKVEHTVRYLGIELEDALEIAERTEM